MPGNNFPPLCELAFIRLQRGHLETLQLKSWFAQTGERQEQEKKNVLPHGVTNFDSWVWVMTSCYSFIHVTRFNIMAFHCALVNVSETNGGSSTIFSLLEFLTSSQVVLLIHVAFCSELQDDRLVPEASGC